MTEPRIEQLLAEYHAWADDARRRTLGHILDRPDALATALSECRERERELREKLNRYVGQQPFEGMVAAQPPSEARTSMSGGHMIDWPRCPDCRGATLFKERDGSLTCQAKLCGWKSRPSEASERGGT